MMISKKYFLIDTFSNVMYFGSKFVFNLIVYSLFINAFDIEEYGVYIFFATLLGQFEFIQLGFATSLQKFIPIYQDKKAIINLIFLVGIVYLLFGVIFSLIIGTLSYLNFFDLLRFDNSWIYIKHLIYFAPLIWFFKVFSFALKGSKDFRTENMINLIFLFLELIIIFTMIEYKFGLSEILFSVLLILLLKHICHFIAYYSRHEFILNQIHLSHLISQFQAVKNFSFWNFISAFSGTVMNQFDKVLVAVFIGPSALTIYYGINQFLKFYTSVSGVINSSVIPYFSKKVSFSNNKIFNEIALNGTTLTSYVGFILAGILILFSKVIFSLISKEYLMEYLTVFNIGIILCALVSFRSFINKLYLCEPKYVKRLSLFGIATTLIYPIIFWFLTSHFQTQGAILSPIVSHLIIYPFGYFNFKRTYLRLKFF